MCVIICSKTFVSIKNVKTKFLFDNKIKINYINKCLVNEINLFIRHETIILIIITRNNNVKFVKIYNNLKIRLRKIIIIISIFVIFKIES